MTHCLGNSRETHDSNLFWENKSMYKLYEFELRFINSIISNLCLLRLGVLLLTFWRFMLTEWWEVRIVQHSYQLDSYQRRNIIYAADIDKLLLRNIVIPEHLLFVKMNQTQLYKKQNLYDIQNKKKQKKAGKQIPGSYLIRWIYVEKINELFLSK